MSQENVDRIRRAHDVLNVSDLGSEDARRVLTELFHPDVEWHDQRELPGATVHYGIEAVLRHLVAAQEALDYDSTDLLDLLDVGPRVVAVYRLHAHGRTSGVTVERDAVHVLRFQGAKVDRVDIFGTRSEALEAVGLRE
ncbi:MAG: nuclear transport factor 2 family protein [Thermoleophilaceae bacterium]|nr:nuclear transport factor 2 family protein [Thermoleophilaceae bacterium]